MFQSHQEPSSSLSTARCINFDFDDAGLKSEYAAPIEQHGKCLASHPSLAVKVEGNTDERGRFENNLALGLKRAQAVGQALEVFGVKPDQLEAASWGQEKPEATEHDEPVRAQDRRADLRYPLK